MQANDVVNKKNALTLNLTTKITLCFVFIGTVFTFVILFNYFNGLKVGNQLKFITDESTPTVQYSSRFNNVVSGYEPDLLALRDAKVATDLKSAEQSLTNRNKSLEEILNSFNSLNLTSSDAKLIKIKI
ncbi:hypothetical protein [Vibrio nitrifigilis]|uniref:Methyl-accepting chemotaxis protein n=1 Tax=Vibrio nitrifigilis TaxID=2789781 RepID=A0ABS0GIN0_9VIBR|nr:hypothetical protein [Vibrio nitrifigilis]MBF9002048.1 hypothetical protein [Vibrio nitrifigilis]